MKKLDLDQYNQVDKNYFCGYADFSAQAGMLDDLVRTNAYYDAVLNNKETFKDKVVIDVGTGTGILAIFAARAGAKKVYAVEACPSMSFAATKLIADNDLSDIIEVVTGKVEEIDIAEKADIIISEPMGIYLFHENMIQSYLLAKEKWLKPDGLMFPETANLYIAPMNASDTIKSIDSSCRGWLDKSDFFSINYESFYKLAKTHETNKVYIDQIDPEKVISEPSVVAFDLVTTKPNDINNIDVTINSNLKDLITFNGLAIWFDVTFPSTNERQPVVLSTSPNSPLTHWYQSMLLLKKPVSAGTELLLSMKSNESRAYDFEIINNTKKAPTQYIDGSLQQYAYMDHYENLNMIPNTKFGFEE